MSLERMWVNQPSTQQLYHNEHGKAVLADLDVEDEFVYVYYAQGATISSRMHKSALSPCHDHEAWGTREIHHLQRRVDVLEKENGKIREATGEVTDLAASGDVDELGTVIADVAIRYGGQSALVRRILGEGTTLLRIRHKDGSVPVEVEMPTGFAKVIGIALRISDSFGGGEDNDG